MVFTRILLPHMSDKLLESAGVREKSVSPVSVEEALDIPRLTPPMIALCLPRRLLLHLRLRLLCGSSHAVQVQVNTRPRKGSCPSVAGTPGSEWCPVWCRVSPTAYHRSRRALDSCRARIATETSPGTVTLLPRAGRQPFLSFRTWFTGPLMPIVDNNPAITSQQAQQKFTRYTHGMHTPTGCRIQRRPAGGGRVLSSYPQGP